MSGLPLRSSFQKKLMWAFLTVGVIPLLVCVLMILNLFRFTLASSADSIAGDQLSAMTSGFEELLTACGEVLEDLGEQSGRKEKLGLEREWLLREREEGRRKAQGPAAEEQLREWLAAERLDRRMAECFVEAVRVFEGRRLEASLLGREEILRRMEG